MIRRRLVRLIQRVRPSHEGPATVRLVDPIVQNVTLGEFHCVDCANKWLRQSIWRVAVFIPINQEGGQQ